MNLVLDANELFSAIIAKGKGFDTKKHDIFFSDKVKLFAPTLLFKELEKNRNEIRRKSGFSDTDFDIFVGVLKLRIEAIPVENFSGKLKKARKVSPHLKDLPYFALALKLNCPIWSGEKKFKEQSTVDVFNTKDLVKELNL